jgi:hypothetical protein
MRLRPLLYAAIVLLTGLGIWFFSRSKPAPPSQRQSPPADRTPPSIESRSPDPEPTPRELVAEWRKIILTRDVRRWEQWVSLLKRQWNEVRPHVLELAKNDADGRVRAVNLGLLKEPGLRPLYLEMLQKDPSPYVRENCCIALGLFGTADDVAVLEEFTSDPEPAGARAASEAIAKIRSR